MTSSAPQEVLDPVTQIEGALLKLGGRSFLCLLGSKILSMATSIYLARVLGKAELGVFSLIVSFVDLSMLITAQSLPLAVVKYLADKREKENVGGLIITAFSTMLATMAVVVLLILSLSDWIANSLYYEPRMVPLFKIAALLILVNTFHAILGALLQGFQKILWVNIIHLATGFALLPFTVVLVYFFSTRGALLAIGATTVFVILPISVSVIVREFARHQISWRKMQPRVPHLLKLLDYSIPAFLSGLTSIPQFLIISTWLSRESGFSAVGLFSVAMVFPRNLGILSSALSVPYIPLISELHSTQPQALAQLVPRTQSTFSLLLMIPAFLLAALSKTIMLVLYGEAYAPAWSTLFVLSFYAYLAGVNDTIGHVLAGTGRMWSGFILNSLHMSLLLLIGYWLIPPFSYLGAGMSYALACCFHTLSVYIFVRWRMKIAITDFWTITWLPLVVFILIFIPLSFIASLKSGTTLAVIVAVAASVLASKVIVDRRARRKSGRGGLGELQS